MNVRRMAGVVLVAGLCLAGQGRAVAQSQCCLSNLFSGCFSCCQPPPVAYAVAPVAAPIMAPVMAPVPVPPPPVMVPVQQTSYVPETTYRTEYRCVPVTSYKPSCEIDPCTGCPVECMQPTTQYVQQPVSVPVTQYRAVTTTKYVQMQPGYAAPPAAGYPAVAPGFAPMGAPAASPFSGVQAAPQAWGAAGADVRPPMPAPAVAPPTLPPGMSSPAPIMPAPSLQYYPPSSPAQAQMIVPQAGMYPSGAAPAGTYAPVQAPAQPQLKSIEPPALSPAPSLKPIPELPRTNRPDATGDAAATSGSGYTPPATFAPALQPGMPVLPGAGPGPTTSAFPRLLEPTSHTTSWGPSDGGVARVQYPTAALPTWRNAQQ